MSLLSHLDCECLDHKGTRLNERKGAEFLSGTQCEQMDHIKQLYFTSLGSICIPLDKVSFEDTVNNEVNYTI